MAQVLESPRFEDTVTPVLRNHGAGRISRAGTSWAESCDLATSRASHPRANQCWGTRCERFPSCQPRASASAPTQQAKRQRTESQECLHCPTNLAMAGQLFSASSDSFQLHHTSAPFSRLCKARSETETHVGARSGRASSRIQSLRGNRHMIHRMIARSTMFCSRHRSPLRIQHIQRQHGLSTACLCRSR